MNSEILKTKDLNKYFTRHKPHYAGGGNHASPMSCKHFQKLRDAVMIKMWASDWITDFKKCKKIRNIVEMQILL